MLSYFPSIVCFHLCLTFAKGQLPPNFEFPEGGFELPTSPRLTPGSVPGFAPGMSPKVNERPGFRWANCGGPDAIGQIDDIQIKPFPIRAGSTVTIGGKGDLFQQFPTDSIGKIEVWRVVRLLGVDLFRINIPFVCVGNRCMHSACNFALHPLVCKDILRASELFNLNVTCDCNTFKPAHYELYDFDVPVPSIPTNWLTWLASGSYMIKGQLLSKDGKQLGCYWGEGDFSIS